MFVVDESVIVQCPDAACAIEESLAPLPEDALVALLSYGGAVAIYETALLNGTATADAFSGASGPSPHDIEDITRHESEHEGGAFVAPLHACLETVSSVLGALRRGKGRRPAGAHEPRHFWRPKRALGAALEYALALVRCSGQLHGPSPPPTNTPQDTLSLSSPVLSLPSPSLSSLLFSSFSHI